MSMYTTAQLLAANEQKFKFDPLFLRLFFRESYPFTTEKVYLSQIPGLVNMALYVSPIVSGEVILFSLGASMVLGGVAQMLAPKARTPRTQTTDNGKQNTYFSSLDNMVAQGNVLPVLYGEMRVGSRVVSQEISTADEGDGGQVVVIGR